MKRKQIGTFLIVLGLLLVAAALALFCHNRLESSRAYEAAQEILAALDTQLPPAHTARETPDTRERARPPAPATTLLSPSFREKAV